MSLSPKDKKILYEKAMKKTICPKDIKRYIFWVETQLQKGPPLDPNVREALLEMLTNIQ